ncbi:MAG: DUF2497 domain-containing protein [Pseudomonadota bacterium]
MENAQPEPSMEEILASIRRIISEDDENGASAPEPKASSGPESASKPVPVKATAPKPAEDGAKPHLETEDVEMIKKNVAAAAESEANEAILDEGAADAASSAFATLSQSVRVTDGPGRTLEDIVTEMLRPMVKNWLDANLPAIVEDKVEEEVQRVARRRR